MGWVWSEYGQIQTQTHLFFIDPNSDPDPKGPKLSDPDPPDLMGLGSLMGLKQSLFDCQN